MSEGNNGNRFGYMIKHLTDEEQGLVTSIATFVAGRKEESAVLGSFTMSVFAHDKDFMKKWNSFWVDHLNIYVRSLGGKVRETRSILPTKREGNGESSM